MSYKKRHNSSSNWRSYCEENQVLIRQLQLPAWVFSKELNFREFATSGHKGVETESKFDFEMLEDDLFWKLFGFINCFFEFDSTLFTKFEESRLKKR